MKLSGKELQSYCKVTANNGTNAAQMRINTTSHDNTGDMLASQQVLKSFQIVLFITYSFVHLFILRGKPGVFIKHLAYTKSAFISHKRIRREKHKLKKLK